MAFTKFPSELNILTFETAELVQLGRYKVPESTELLYAVMRLFKVGAGGGGEVMSLRLYGDSSYNGPFYAESAAIAVASISGVTTNWIGDVRFDFTGRKNLNQNSWYYLAISTANYTRNGDTSYLGAALDWPFALNTVSGSGPAAAVSLLGYRE